jgi:hypothetical protein
MQFDHVQMEIVVTWFSRGADLRHIGFNMTLLTLKYGLSILPNVISDAVGNAGLSPD